MLEAALQRRYNLFGNLAQLTMNHAVLEDIVFTMASSFLTSNKAFSNNNKPVIYSSVSRTSGSSNNFKVKLIENPDPNFVCMHTGKSPARRYCNVYYECSDAGLPPTKTYECMDGFFDRSQGL